MERVGYYLVSSYNGYERGDFETREGSRAFHLTFIHRSSTDEGVLSVGLHLITSGPRGPRGRPGKDASASIQRSEQSFALLHSSLSRSLKTGDRLPFDFSERIYLNLPNGEISSPLHNRELSSSSIVVSKSCPPGKRVLIGSCKWELLSKKETRNTWCRAEDFVTNKRREQISLETREELIEGKTEQVVSSISFRNKEGEEEKLEMNSQSCLLIETNLASESQLKECGFFCFFQKTEPVFESESVFSCKYVPPSFFGMDELFGLLPSSKRVEQSFEEKIQMIILELVCEDK